MSAHTDNERSETAVDVPRLVRGYEIRDRISGHKAPGEWGLADDMEQNVECPECGAEPGQQCSVEDPDQSGFGIETGAHVHMARILSENASVEAAPTKNDE